MIKFIHCADLHLNAPFELSDHVPESIMKDIQQASFISFERVVSDAIRQSVDFILISGDICDSKNTTLNTAVFLKKQFNRLKDANIFVYIVRGSDDVADLHIKFPDNVIIFGEQVETYEFMMLSGTKVYIHGVSYYANMNYQQIIELFPTSQVDTSIHIGMLYGELVDKDKVTNKSFYKEQLNSKMYHYWALGKKHIQETISTLPHIHYPGTIQGYKPTHTGQCGYLFVEGDHTTIETKFVAVEYIRFLNRYIELDQLDKPSLYKTLKQSRHSDGKTIYTLKVTNPHEQLVNRDDLDEVLSLLKESEANANNFSWIDSIELIEPYDAPTLHHEFDPDVLNDDELVSRALHELTHDETMSRFINIKVEEKGQLLEIGEKRLKARMRDGL